ncbi:cystathionine beta-lyase domain protein, partial [Ostertagia ostertagi]
WRSAGFRNLVLSFVDATFASPICVQPIALGADLCMHSCSKYIGGHTDVIGGCVTTRSLDHWKRLKLQQLTTGSALSPFDAALLARGLKTLPLRVDKICSNAHRIAQFLAQHPKVLHTHYPGLASHPMHEAAKIFMKKWSGMIAFDVGSADAAITVVESVRLIIHAVFTWRNGIVDGASPCRCHTAVNFFAIWTNQWSLQVCYGSVLESKTPTTSSPIWKGPSLGSDQPPSDFARNRNKTFAQVS